MAAARPGRNSAASSVPASIAARNSAWLSTTLKRRNRCDSTACLKRSSSARLARLRATPQAEWVSFYDAGTGLRFRYLGNRSVKRCPDEPVKPCFVLSGPEMGYGSQYLLHFEVTNGSLEEVANKTGRSRATSG
jgi:hypothetical protein